MANPTNPRPDEDEIIRSILRGRKMSATPLDEDSLMRWHIEDWFVEQTKDLQKIRGALDEFEFTDNREYREKAGKLLTAFFAWVKFGGLLDNGPTRKKIDRLRLRFLDVVLARMVGFENRNEMLHDVPRWSSPNVAFGWNAPAHRMKKSHTWRDMAIWAHYELLMRQKIKPTEAVRKLARQFAPSGSEATSAGVSTIQKALANPERRQVKLSEWSDEDLKQMAKLRDYP